MKYRNLLEARLNELNKELKVALLNEWEFDIKVLKEEIEEIENKLYWNSREHSCL